jgi:chorismate mutase
VTRTSLAIALTALAVTAAPITHADTVSPLEPLVDAAAQRLQNADPVAASKYLNGGQIQDPPREQQVLDSVAAAAEAQGADPGYVREVFRDQIDASVGVQYSRFSQWMLDPAIAPSAAPDLAETRATIDALNQTMVREIGVHWPTLHGPTCPAELGSAIVEVVADRQLDPLYRQALFYATHDYCR